MLARSAITRRSLLQIGSVGLGGLTLPGVLRSAENSSQRPAPRAKACILLYMDGGPSQIDLFDLKPEAPAEIRGPWQPIATSAEGVQIGELLPCLARQMHRVLLVRSVRHEETVHDPAVYQMLTGYKHVSSAGGLKVEETDHPHMASGFLRADPRAAAMPAAIQLPETMKMEGRVLPGQNGGILGATFDPFLVELTPEGRVLPPDFVRQREIGGTRHSQRSQLLSRFNRELGRLEAVATTERLSRFQQQALSILAAPSIQQAFDLSLESPETHARYGRHRHGQSVLLARRLVEAGSRFVTVYWGREEQDWADGVKGRFANNPWDTHRNHFPLLKETLAPRADQTLAALLSDLGDRGLLDETLVVWMGDFGRTPRISQPWRSRDHWPDAFSMLLAGAGVKAGTIHGRTDHHAAQVTDDPVSPADITATLLDTLGLNPHLEVEATSGRHHRLSTGRIVREWFA
ncbi:MAG: DUF1501 domain-containing protein [Planctomycetota bacterium]